MNKMFGYLMSAAMVATAAVPAFAQQATTTRTTTMQTTTAATQLSQAQAMESLQKMGYTNITGLHMDDGKWEGKGVKNGQIMEFEMNATTGAMVKQHLDD